ncbi:MAG: glycoside hydrolase family 88 protein [Terriglobia bacterium]
MYTVNGKWNHTGEAWTNWCEGYLPGILWILHELTGQRYWRERAEHYSCLLEERQNDKDVHDLGFIFNSSYGRWYELTHEPKLRKVLIQAGRTLALRYQPKGQYLCSFLGANSLFIDIMMNVGLIFWVARNTHDDQLREIATRHSLTSKRFLVHSDGSTVHEALFDPQSGSFLKENTQQGYRSDSCWSRGLCWALYGFGTAYQFTQDSLFLETAEQCADYYLRHVPDGLVPPWDFQVPPGPGFLWDSSAAAIAASGFWKLSALTLSLEKAEIYRNVTFEILDTLVSPSFLAHGKSGQEGILLHGVYHYHKQLGVDESLMWGDYFFMEALQHALRAMR